jgi:hypothetical protein
MSHKPAWKKKETEVRKGKGKGNTETELRRKNERSTHFFEFLLYCF